MRSRPVAQRRPVKAVIELIQPRLLTYIARHALPEGQRGATIDDVSAEDIHHFVMGKPNTVVRGTVSAGAKELKKLKCTINPKYGVRNVQRLFIRVDEIKLQYRLRVKDKSVIAVLMKNIKPEAVQDTLYAYIYNGNDNQQKARICLKAFHDLLMWVAKYAEMQIKLGLISATNDREGNEDRNNSHNGRSNKRRNRNRNSKEGDANGNNNNTNNRKGDKDRPGNGSGKGPGKKFKCFNCGGDHRVVDCPTIPAARKDWTIRQWIAHAKIKSGNANSPPSFV